MEGNKVLEEIKKGGVEIISEDALNKKLGLGRPLRVKYGIDPTTADIHIGHMVSVRKMRQMQNMGHVGVVIIGDYTAQIGDPTGLDRSRPSLSKEQVRKNATEYMDQLYTVLDKKRTEVHWQSEWFEKMEIMDLIELLGKFTVAQIMAHETFRMRYEKRLPLSMNELLYPILQAYDSVMIKADIELGASEQKFNILLGREIQKKYSQESQVAILSPILIGTDGVNKMSKSLNNYIAIYDTPKEKYGKIMSIKDDLIMNYFELATDISVARIDEIRSVLAHEKKNPMDVKKHLAREIMKTFHNENEIKEAEEYFMKVCSRRERPEEIEELRINSSKIWIVKLLIDARMAKTSGEARRLVRGGAVCIDGNKVVEETLDIQIKKEFLLKVGKRKFIKIRPNAKNGLDRN
ncbi:tyrosine--tRNA ligase [bacterium]|nr:tyrosine--tRNA ligase [bacterium]